MDVPTHRVGDFENEFIRVLETEHNDVLKTLSHGDINDHVTKTLESVAREVSARYKA